MATTNRYAAGAALLLLLLPAGCARTTAPHDWLQFPQRQQFLACGAWAEVETLADTTTQKTDGELLAVRPDSLFLITPLGIAAFARTDITGVTLTHYRTQHQALAAWATFGALSTLSHGWTLAGSLPVWIISGVASAGKASGEPIIRYRPKEKKSPQNRYQETEEDIINREWEQMIRYARYPQGIPETIDRNTIRQFEPPATPPRRR